MECQDYLFFWFGFNSFPLFPWTFAFVAFVPLVPLFGLSASARWLDCCLVSVFMVTLIRCERSPHLRYSFRPGIDENWRRSFWPAAEDAGRTVAPASGHAQESTRHWGPSGLDPSMRYVMARYQHKRQILKLFDIEQSHNKLIRKRISEFISF